MSNKSLFWTLVALNVLDVVLTALIIDLGGHEANPWINGLIAQFGYFSGMLIAKVPPLAIIGFIIYRFWDKISDDFRKFTRGVMIAFNLLYVALLTYQVGLYLVLITL